MELACTGHSQLHSAFQYVCYATVTSFRIIAQIYIDVMLLAETSIKIDWDATSGFSNRRPPGHTRNKHIIRHEL